MVVDLRGINSLVVPKLVQLPQIEEILDDICSKRPHIFSTLDIFGGWTFCVSKKLDGGAIAGSLVL